MLKEDTIQDGHLSPETITALANGAYSGRDAGLLLLHLEACPSCMDTYIDTLCTSQPDEPAAGTSALQDRILTSINREKRRIRGRTLAFNTAKISVAVALTMLLFFSGAFHRLEEGTSYILQQISADQTPPPSGDDTEKNHWEQLAFSYNAGFQTLVDRIQAFFIGDDEYERK